MELNARADVQVGRKRHCRELGEVLHPAISILDEQSPKSETLDKFVAAGLRQ
jgi:hypothetical protein